MNDKVPGGHAYTVYKWNDNTGNEVQEYWLVDGMGHAWSGGKPDICSDPQGPSASLAMYLFFKNHRM
jgi:poly(3-hydroxybutyrate) depolymerase